MGRGALKFKGESKTLPSSSRKKDLTKSKKRPLPSATSSTTDTSWILANESTPKQQVSLVDTIEEGKNATSDHQQAHQSSSPPSQVILGRGTITVSGTVVTGYGTKFNDDVQVGDAIIIGNEMRIITMRLSDISLNISTMLSSTNITSLPISYSYIRKPRNKIKETAIEQRKRAIENAADIERHQNAFSSIVTTTTGSTIVEGDPMNTNDSTEVVYRERTEHGNYRIKRMKVNQSLNITDRSDMLNIRSKKTSDKYC
jgi:hypothetical protein